MNFAAALAFPPIGLAYGDLMDRELPNPVDLPEGTVTTVKVQRPPEGRGDGASWLLFAEGAKHFRVLRGEQVPQLAREILKSARKAYFKAQIEHGEWRLLEIVADEDW